jgi:hypothetical protein
MSFRALASDYDGTLACDGKTDDATLNALRDFKASGKRLIPVTGRELPELRAVFCARYSTAPDISTPGSPRTVRCFTCQRGVVATRTPNERVMLDTIRELNLGAVKRRYAASQVD